MTFSHRAVFLDRDGVINKLVPRSGGNFSPQRVCDFELFSWTSKALELLRLHDYQLIVVSNQPDIARGFLEKTELSAMHTKLKQLTAIEHIYVCEHDSVDNCACRKPRPGLILRAADDHRVNIAESWMIGDRATDIEAGRLAGTKLIYVASGQEQQLNAPDVAQFSDLLAAAKYITSFV